MDINTFLKQLKQYGLENEVPNISEDNAAYLLDLVSSIQAKEVLEIGTANGYSTIHFANCIKDWGGSITTIEFSTLSHEAAKKNFEKVGLLNITPLLGNALDILPTLPSKYDFIFIDGMKRRSKDFLALCIPKVKK